MSFFNTADIGTKHVTPVKADSATPGSAKAEFAGDPGVGLGSIPSTESPADRHARLYPVAKINPIQVGAAYQPTFAFLKDVKPSEQDLAATPATRRELERGRKSAAREVLKARVVKRLINSDATTDFRVTGIEHITSRNVTPNRPQLTQATRISLSSKRDFRSQVTGVSAAIPEGTAQAVRTAAPASLTIANTEPVQQESPMDEVADVIVSKAAAQKAASTPGPSKKTVWVTAALVAVAIFIVARR